MKLQKYSKIFLHAYFGIITTLTFGMPLTEQLRVVLYPAMIERLTKGCVNLGASEKSSSLWVGGLYAMP